MRLAEASKNGLPAGFDGSSNPLISPRKSAPPIPSNGALAVLWGLSGADHFAIGLPQRNPRLRRQVHRIPRLHVKSADKRVLVAQRAIGSELPRRVRIDLEALDAGGVAYLL